MKFWKTWMLYWKVLFLRLMRLCLISTINKHFINPHPTLSLDTIARNLMHLSKVEGFFSKIDNLLAIFWNCHQNRCVPKKFEHRPLCNYIYSNILTSAIHTQNADHDQARDLNWRKFNGIATPLPQRGRKLNIMARVMISSFLSTGVNSRPSL